MSIAEMVSTLLAVCGHRLPQAVFTAFLQVTLPIIPIIVALYALRAAGRRNPATRLFLANSALAGVTALLVVAFATSGGTMRCIASATAAASRF